MPKLTSLINRLLEERPTLQGLHNAPNLRDYIRPHMTWGFRPDVFPYAKTLLTLMKEEIKACHDEATASAAERQLSKHFSVETGAHLSLPRAYDRADRRSSAVDNVNTLIFQALLYSAAARLELGDAFNISFVTGRISITCGGSSCAYFQPDPGFLVRVHSNRWKRSPESYLPPLTLESFENNIRAACKGNPLGERAQKRIAIIQSCITKHPDHFNRQIATAYSELYNELYPPGVRQITVDYEPLAKRFLLSLLADKASLTHRLFTTEEGRNFLLHNFEGIATGWKKGEAPFDNMDFDQGYPRFTRETYKGDLSPEAISQALTEKRIMPKTALLFLVFMVEGGLAPIGGMMQTLYATQIRDLAIKWLRQHDPNDRRLEALAAIPAELAVLTPAWGFLREAPHQPVGYNDALEGWQMDKRTAEDLLKVKGSTALKAGTLVMSEYIFEKGMLDAEEKKFLLKELHDSDQIVRV